MGPSGLNYYKTKKARGSCIQWRKGKAGDADLSFKSTPIRVGKRVRDERVEKPVGPSKKVYSRGGGLALGILKAREIVNRKKQAGRRFRWKERIERMVAVSKHAGCRMIADDSQERPIKVQSWIWCGRRGLEGGRCNHVARRKGTAYCDKGKEGVISGRRQRIRKAQASEKKHCSTNRNAYQETAKEKRTQSL